MPGERLPMRKIVDVLRLHAEGLSKRKIAASLSIGATSAGECVRRARRAGLSWPLPENLDEDALERVLYPPPPTMRQLHAAGERMFVDYAGKTLEVIDGTTGEVRVCQLFVAALWRVQLHVRRGDLHTEPCRLDRVARPGVLLLYGRCVSDCLR